jgi:hypothetical protein
MMARPILFKGPRPRNGQRLCAVCAAVAKGFLLQASQASISEANAGSPEDTPVTLVIRPDVLPPFFVIEDAVTVAIVQLPAAGSGQMGAVPADVCWSHLNGLVIREGGMVVPATAAQMPHERGAVDLAARGRRG